MMRIRIYVVIFVLCGSMPIKAEETDQYTLPPYELQDLGILTSRVLYSVLESLVKQVNNEMRSFEPTGSQGKRADMTRQKKASYFADLLYERSGPGFPRWLRPFYFSNRRQASFVEIYPWRTIYWHYFLSPFSLIRLSPTIRMYGNDFGTDKLSHFFMQGHTYYKMYNFLVKRHTRRDEAYKAIINFGRLIEYTYLGTWINGVYSNADLAANFAGWKFYRNLTERVEIGHQILPPILIFNKDHWEISPFIKKDELIKPFLSVHLNEAWNPCRYNFLRGEIRRQIKRRCGAWIARGLTVKLVEEKLNQVCTWYGEDYGYWLPLKQAVSLKTCFE